MMVSKAVLISIRPEWCEKIANGQKTIEIRKNRPKIETPFKCYIYCTKNGRPLVFGDVPCADGWREEYTRTYGYSKAEVERIWGAMNGQVIGEFVCDWIKDFGLAYDGKYSGIDNIHRLSCLSFEEMYEYIGEGYGYGWHISNLVVYDKPKELSEFHKPSAESVEELLANEILCDYCVETGRGEHAFSSSPNGPIMCEGRFCDKAYQRYLDDEGFTLYRPPQSWCYVEELI